MEVLTTRFGTVEIAADDQICFPAGLPGLEECRQWVLLADPSDGRLAWLQSIQWPEVALAVVCPRHYVPDYAVRASRMDLRLLGLLDLSDTQVLAIVGQDESGLMLNLKAPLLINTRQRLGGQVISNADWPIRFRLDAEQEPMRKSA